MDIKKLAAQTTQKIKSILSNRVVKISLIAIPLIIITYFGITYYLSMRETSRNAYEFVPENPLSIIQVNNSQEFVKFLSTDKIVSDFENLTSLINFNDLIYNLDSLALKNNSINEIWNKGSFLLTTHFMGSDLFETVLIMSLPHPSYENKVISFFQQASIGEMQKSKSFKGTDILSYKFLESQDLFIAVKQGVLLISKSEQLIKSCIQNSESNTNILSNIKLKEIVNTAGKNSVANIFINYQFAYRFMSLISDSEILKQLEILNNFGTWSGFDLHLRDDRITFSGYTNSEEKRSIWLNQFADNQPQKISIINVLPSSTTSFMWLGFDNYLDFRENQKSMLTSQQRITEFSNNLTNLKNRTRVQNINELIFPFIGNELGIFWTANRNLESGQQVYAIFNTRNTSVFCKNLTEIANSASKWSIEKHDTINYRNHIINYIAADYMLFDLFGSMFRSIDKTFYTIHKNYWVVSNSQDAIKYFLDASIAGRTIDKQQMYSEFSQSMSQEANVYIYASPKRLKKQIQKFSAERIKENINNKISSFDNFEAFGIQFSASEKMFHSIVSLFRSETSDEEAGSGWEINFEAPISSGPWFIDLAEQNSKAIIVFDAFNQMYFLSEKGELIWKIPLSEKPLSRVYTVDAFKNGKKQYLFNTENNLYLIDRLGNNVAPFPLKLPRQASGAVQVFDYDNNREYRVLYSGIDNIIYNFNLKGEQTQGWEKPKIENPSNSEIKHIRMMGSDVIIIRDINNKLLFYNRRGVKLFEIENFRAGSYSDIYAAPNLCNCYITTNQEGQISMIESGGNIKLKTIHDATPGHVFIYEDFDNSGEADFIYIDRGKAFVFAKDESLKYNLDIASNIGRKASFVKNSPYGPLLLIFSSDGKEIFIINKSGRVLKENTFASNNHADFYFSKERNKLLIISSQNSSVFLHIVE